MTRWIEGLRTEKVRSGYRDVSVEVFEIPLYLDNDLTLLLPCLLAASNII